jgi:antirestriction protein
MTTTTPRIYVGTYHKYNSGSIAGKWLDLEDYDSKDDFHEACEELHADEDDPELMFQDYEGIPEQYISESSISDEFFELQEAISTSGLDAEIFYAGLDLDIPLEHIEDLYQGEYSTDKDLAYQLADDIGAIDENASWPMNCIDWERAARDLMYDNGSSDGHYFRTSY